MPKSFRSAVFIFLLVTLIGGCARTQQAPRPQPAAHTAGGSQTAYVAPQSAPVRAPTYPALGGAVFGLGYIPLVQGR